MRTDDYDFLVTKSNEWKLQADDFDVLGEIALSQEELDHLLPILGRFRSRVDEPAMAFAFAVAAVNWAYWRGVETDESQGFRKSFMMHALGYCDMQEWNNSWGPSIEAAICDWSKRPPVSGPYRYVGLILRHAGVPHARIPQLADLLRDIDRDIGWAHLVVAKDWQIRNHVAVHFGSGIIGGHLCSDAGIAYLRSLCADLIRLRSQPSQIQNDLPGYRPGLLPALMACLPAGSADSTPTSFRWPFVALDPTSGQLQLVFDERLVRRREPIHCDQWSRRLFDTRLDLGPGGVEPSAEFSGHFPDGRGWSIRGWRYTDARAWALFRADGKLVITHSHDDSVSTGHYLLAVVPSLDLTALWPDALDDGERQLPDGTECRIWQVELAEGDDNKLPGLRVTATMYPWIECANSGPLTRWTDFDAVCASDPVIEVGGWTGRSSRRYRITVDSPFRQYDLHPTPSLGGPVTFTLSELPIGVPAEVTLTPVGYQHGPRATQSLRVIRFPGSLVIEDGLWPFERDAILRVDVSEELQLHPVGDTRVELTNGRNTVVVPSPGCWATIALRLADSELQLRLPAPRASLTESESPERPAVIDRASLRQMCAPGTSAATFTITALPGCNVDLLVTDPDGVGREWRRGLKLGSNGRLNLAATELVDVVRNESGILQLIVRCGRFEASTGALFVEPTARDLERDQSNPLIAPYIELLRQPLKSLDPLDAILEITFLHRYATIIAMVDVALEFSKILPSPRVPPEGHQWVIELRELLATRPKTPGAIASTWKEQLSSWFLRAPIPFLPARWEAATRAIVDDIDRTVDVSGSLQHLLAGERDTLLPDGVVHGWRYYQQAFADTTHQATRLIQANDFLMTAARGEPPWSAIALRLSAWTMLRAGAVVEFSRAVDQFGESQFCPGLDDQLRRTASILAMTPVCGSSSLQGGLELSSLERDRLLAAAFAGGFEEWRLAAQKCWLASWLAWRWSVIEHADAEREGALYRIVNEHVDDVPLRLRDRVMEELRSRTPQRISSGCAFT